MSKDRMIKLLMMTTSENDNEALVAIRKANGVLAEMDITWEGYLEGKLKEKVNNSYKGYEENHKKESYKKAKKAKKYTDEEEIELMFKIVLMGVKGSFADFIISIYDWWIDNRFLTEKQYEALCKAYQYRK